MTLPFNKVCELEDFEDPELARLIEEIFPHETAFDGRSGAEDSKQWEIAMSCRALRAFGAIDREAVVLGVGAGAEATSFYLTRHVKQVVAIDLYLTTGQRPDGAQPLMLVDPERFAPYEFEPSRLVVQHMDGRILRYPDDTFDGIFSSGSIEHLGGLDGIANAAYEMGRVVKPGGVVTLATGFKIAGPDGDGWDPGTLVLDEERIRRYIVEASGLEPVDELRTKLSERTLRNERDLTSFLESVQGGGEGRAACSAHPNVVLYHEGYVFCSVHLALRKPAGYPVADNAWARPSAATERAVAARVLEAERGLISRRAASTEFVQLPAAAVDAFPELEPLLAEWDMYWSGAITSRVARKLPGPLASLYRMYLRIRYLGPVWNAESRFLHALTAALHRRAPDDVALLRGEIDDVRARLEKAEARLGCQEATPRRAVREGEAGREPPRPR